jgi:hypothetical protein
MDRLLGVRAFVQVAAAALRPHWSGTRTDLAVEREQRRREHGGRQKPRSESADGIDAEPAGQHVDLLDQVAEPSIYRMRPVEGLCIDELVVVQMANDDRAMFTG